ncbi:glycoprotein 3-alpha-L-fucosyltransferase A-like [Pararge aegeria]|uniref:glycoprotein 3-alpha-L-fucosyltransferase A-like n=1 Tax=Pararge aegeria TaxID=116150 RepID=UPI0019D2BC1C|nr:glycoprotein 3-alpha-L-fucosyltransferase A-like [Pararge aegeria]
MWMRAARVLRRLVLLVLLLLTALVLLLLPPPPQYSHQARVPQLRKYRYTGEDPVKLKNTNKDIKENPQLPWFMSGGKQRPLHHDPYTKLFPEDAPGHDRIVEQLTYILPKDEDVSIVKILLANGLGNWDLPGGRTEFIRNKCPVDACSITIDMREAATVDVVLYEDYHNSIDVKRPPNQIWILYYLECPYNTATLRSTLLNVFNWTATYRRDSDIVAPYEKWVYHDTLVTEKVLERNYAANKTKMVAWFVSNCHAHNRRLQYAKQLSKFISVDIYGACGSQNCPRVDPDCFKMLDKEYKFYLAFENSNCQDYITEKFFVNSLQHDVLPIVMGARPSEYAAVAPHNSYIHVDEFAGPEELAAYLRRLDEDDTLFNSYFKWKGTGEFINTFFFCRVCAMVHASARRQRNVHYTDVQAWWRNATCTQTD